MTSWVFNTNAGEYITKDLIQVVGSGELDDIADVIFYGFCADLSNYCGFKIEQGRLIQVTGSWKFFPNVWVACRKEKLPELKTFLFKCQE